MSHPPHLRTARQAPRVRIAYAPGSLSLMLSCLLDVLQQRCAGGMIRERDVAGTLAALQQTGLIDVRRECDPAANWVTYQVKTSANSEGGTRD